MEIKRKLTVRLESRKGLDGELLTDNIPIYIDITFLNQRLKYYLNRNSDFKRWDNKNQRVKINFTNKQGFNSTEINSTIDEVKDFINKCFKSFEYNNIIPTTKDLRDSLDQNFKNKQSREKELTFFDVYNIFTDLQKDNWSISTLKKYNTILSQLQLYNKEGQKVTFDSFNESFVTDYFDFCRNILNHRNQTIQKNWKQIKCFLNWSYTNKYHNNEFFRDYNPKLPNIDTKVIYLLPEELNLLENYEPLNERLSRIRDVFVFGCYTSLRFGDIMNLKKSDVKNDSIEFTTQKTRENLKIYLNDHSKRIIDKYINIPPQEKNKSISDFLFWQISNQKFNFYIKELAGLIGLNRIVTQSYFKGNKRIDENYKLSEIIHSHNMRKTFVSLGLINGIPAEYIMAWTGHKDHKTMKKYLGISDQHLKELMNKFNN